MWLTHLCIKPSSHSAVPILTCVLRKPSEVVPSFPFGSGAAWFFEVITLFSGLGTDVHFSGDETGVQWEDYLFEFQNAVG